MIESVSNICSAVKNRSTFFFALRSDEEPIGQIAKVLFQIGTIWKKKKNKNSDIYLY